MSRHEAFRRSAMPPQVAQKLDTITIPAPTRGIIQSENETYMQPGSAWVLDNWKPTLRGLSLRGGFALHTALPETTRVVSAFEYASGINQQIFAANATKVYNVTGDVPELVKDSQTSGNYVASQLANQGGDWMLVANDTGDPILRYNGTTWATLATTTPTAWTTSHAYVIGDRVMDDTRIYWKCAIAHTSAASGDFEDDYNANPTYWERDMASDDNSWITGPPDTPVENGGNLTYVCKYRGRYFFIELNSMNAWYLELNNVGGQLQMIPLAGATTKGGHLLFCATWSVNAGDGIDDKLVFCTDLGELIIFTGGNPSDAGNWKQEGRYQVGAPLGMNAWLSVGGDLLIATVDGIVPVSGAITKGAAELELAAVTRPIRQMWREEVLDKRNMPWTLCNWPEYGGIFVTWPGGAVDHRLCAVVNSATGAWTRFTGWDCTCFMKMQGQMFFGTQDGKIMQADVGGTDDGDDYVATLVGGWDMFASPSQTITWRQARASFSARAGEPFIPQLAGTVDYVVTLPTPPPAGVDPGPLSLWDEGLWDVAVWDGAPAPAHVVRNTGWVSIGVTGYSHAPIVQVRVSQQSKPQVDLISIAATFERAGMNV